MDVITPCGFDFCLEKWYNIYNKRLAKAFKNKFIKKEVFFMNCIVNPKKIKKRKSQAKKCLESNCPYANECYDIAEYGTYDCYIKNEAVWIAEEIGDSLFNEYYEIHDDSFDPFLQSDKIIRELTSDYMFRKDFNIKNYSLLNTYPFIKQDKLKKAFDEAIVKFEKCRGIGEPSCVAYGFFGELGIKAL
jgi:hypothetical protein